jgi:hypothetical protein
MSPRITGPKPSGASLNPFDDFATLTPSSPKRQDVNPLSPRRNSFQLGQHQGATNVCPPALLESPPRER